MDEFLQKFTQMIISDAEAEVNVENKKDANAEYIKTEIARKREGEDGDAKAYSVNGGLKENKTQQSHNCVELNSHVATKSPLAKKKKRRAPPPPVTNPATSTKEPGTETPVNTTDVEKKTNATTPQQNAGKLHEAKGEKMEVKSEERMSDREVTTGSTSLEESPSDLSLSNPFHPQYEMHIGQLQKHASLSSITVSESCSEFSLSNPFHTRYDELTGTGSLTESESELSLSNPFNPHYEEDMKAANAIKEVYLIADIQADEHQNEPDKFAEQAVKGKKGLFKRVKRLFASLILCLRKNSD